MSAKRYVPPHLRQNGGGSGAPPAGLCADSRIRSASQSERGRVCDVFEDHFILGFADKPMKKICGKEPEVRKLKGLKYQEVKTEFRIERSRNKEVFTLVSPPKVVASEEAEIHQVLYKAGALIFRRSPETRELQVAILRNNNTASFIYFKFALKHFLRAHREHHASDEYESAVENLIDWAEGLDPILKIHRPRTWRSYELAALKSLTNDHPELNPAFFGWELNLVKCISQHRNLCVSLATLAETEINRRCETEEDDGKFNYRVKWDLPKGSHDKVTLHVSAKREVDEEMGIKNLPDPFKVLQISEKVEGHDFELINTFLCWEVEPHALSAFSRSDCDKPSINIKMDPKSGRCTEFEYRNGHMGDSQWCNVVDFLKDLQSDFPEFWAIPDAMGVSASGFARQLQTAIQECFLDAYSF